MKRFLVILFPVVTGVTGFLIGRTLSIADQQKNDYLWMEAPSGEISHGYSGATSPSPEIPLPAILPITGKVKFVRGALPSIGDSIGYIIEVPVDKLEPAAIPAAYAVERSIGTANGTLTLSPVKEVTYEIIFSLSLKDEDGFVIEALESEPLLLTSGTTNKFQGLVQSKLATFTRGEVKRVAINMTIGNCVTCGELYSKR